MQTSALLQTHTNAFIKFIVGGGAAYTQVKRKRAHGCILLGQEYEETVLMLCERVWFLGQLY